MIQTRIKANLGDVEAKQGVFNRLCLLFFVVFTLLIAACSSESSNGWKEVDFMKDGLPVKIKAPANVKVTKSNFSGSEEFKLTGADNYGMSVLVLEATNSDVNQVKSDLEALVKKGRYFNQFVQNDAHGFVYQIMIDSTRSVYGFRKIKIQGEKQIVFQNPYMSKLTKEEAIQLYEAVSD